MVSWWHLMTTDVTRQLLSGQLRWLEQRPRLQEVASQRLDLTNICTSKTTKADGNTVFV